MLYLSNAPLNNKAFRNLFCNPKKEFSPLRDLSTRIIEAVNHSSNSTMAFKIMIIIINNNNKKLRLAVNLFCKCYC